MSAWRAGQRVRTKAQNPHGHTRLPGYLQERSGTIVRVLGTYPLADDRAVALSQVRSSALYTVQFDAAEVWPQSSWRGSICADLFEEYLEAAER